MATGNEFITLLEGAMGKSVGRIAGQSILTNQLKKLNKDRNALNADDCKILTKNIISSIALFATTEEAGVVQSQLERLVRNHFA